MPPFSPRALLDSAGIAAKMVKYRRGDAIYSQGENCAHVMYVQTGGVKLSVRSTTGREATIAILGPGEFFGESCLAGRPTRASSAISMTQSTILLIGKRNMHRLLRLEHTMSDRFIAHMLSRNVSIEQDLVDQIFNSSERRLARALLLLARYGERGKPRRVVPKVSHERLAALVGTTRARVRFFLEKFRKLGFIEQNGELTINSSLLAVVLRE